MIKTEAIIALLEQAGRQIILPAFERSRTTLHKADGSVVTETDITCQQFLKTALADMAPDIDFLGEEMSESEQMACLHSDRRYWCLDPLDGTTNFIAAFPMFAISLALIEQGRPVQGYIHDPIHQETFMAVRGQGAWLNGQPLHAATEDTLKDAVGSIDFKRLPPALAEKLIRPGLYRSQRNIGTCALEWAWLAAGRMHFIIHGGEKLWDYAAGSLIAAEAGCCVGDFSAAPFFPARQLSSPVLACCTRALQQQLMADINGQLTRLTSRIQTRT